MDTGHISAEKKEHVANVQDMIIPLTIAQWWKGNAPSAREVTMRGITNARKGKRRVEDC
jgi:hypothetical protein